MKLYMYIPLLLLFFSCHKDNNTSIDLDNCEVNCVMLSELQTKHDYYLPINLFNDISDSEIEVISLNGNKLDFKYGRTLVIEEAGFYEILIDYYNAALITDTILFTLQSEERKNAEWGIEVWMPEMFETVDLTGSEEIEVIYPGYFTDNINVPFIFYVRQGNSLVQTFSDANHLSSGKEFYIKRGVGSVSIDAAVLENNPEFNIGGVITDLSLSKKLISDIELRGEITEDLLIPSNSFVRITSDLHISGTFSLTIEDGCLITIDEAVNITNDGSVVFQGSQANPIFVTCSEKDKFWGGFISKGGNSFIQANNTIFCQSGYHYSSEYNWGHAKRQALFYTENSKLELDSCFMLDHIGQIFYPQYSTLNLESILVQRVKTGGQLNFTVAKIDNSIFTDFPDDSQLYLDDDNDALYVHASDVTINNCMFMFAKDDGMDSGGALGGVITVNNTRFDACFHEGAALSSKGTVSKTHTFNNCVFTNCGQGLELGYSSPNHTVIANECKFLNNYIGIRYGDNYDWSVIDGKMEINNSQSMYNGKDVWNMVRSGWNPKLLNLQFQNTQVSSFVLQYPELVVINE